MLAARTLGLDCGPMFGFDHAKVSGPTNRIRAYNYA